MAKGANPAENSTLPGKPAKARIGVYLASDLMERLKDAAYWERVTLSAFVENAISEAVAGIEAANGGAVPGRKESPKRGRPFK